jgi:TIR domain/Bacterial extracellular solute-binding protein, family 7
MPEILLFVSHVSEDRSAATEIVDELERRGVRCWIAPRDVGPGKPFDDEIADAIDASRAMLLIFSERCNDSEYIRREVTVAGEAGKIVIPFRIENAQPKRGLRVRLSDLHWIDGFVSRERAIDELLGTFGLSRPGAALQPGVKATGDDVSPVIARSGGEAHPGSDKSARATEAREDERPTKTAGGRLKQSGHYRPALAAGGAVALGMVVVVIWMRSPASSPSAYPEWARTLHLQEVAPSSFAASPCGNCASIEFVCRKGISERSDVVSKKTAVFPNIGLLSSVQSFGATPTPVAAGELYAALQTGVIDCVAGPQ